MNAFRLLTTAIAVFLLGNHWGNAQQPNPDQLQKLQSQLNKFQEQMAAFQTNEKNLAFLNYREREHAVADVLLFAKSVEWILRHNEFFKADYLPQSEKALRIGLDRLSALKNKQYPWKNRRGCSILGYTSEVDGSVQPYALTLPASFKPTERYPLYVKLHGRAGTMNEVNFIHRFEGKPAAKDQSWIQLDVFGRTNNAYRWSGETDVFEAIRDVERRFRIDSNRMTLWGFSMGGAGAWHLAMHHPVQWSSAGAGAGFVDFYQYQNIKEELPRTQHRLLRIYDALMYARNAANVPMITYGGELDKQLLASQLMKKEADRLGVPLKFLVGPKMGHKFDPKSFQTFMSFHSQYSKKGRPGPFQRKRIDFETYTLKYNSCDWIAIEEMLLMYEPTRVQASFDQQTGDLKVTTQNVALLRINRNVAEFASIDGVTLPLSNAAEGLLPDVYYLKSNKGWDVMNYNDSKEFPDNPEGRKRHNLQGPIDDAFTQPFVCVKGTGTPWSKQHHEWALWNLSRFEKEFDKWLRGKVPVISDEEVTEELMAKKNLILFGDPGSNNLLAKILDRLPFDWNKEAIVIEDQSFHPDQHGVCLIYPNPLNPGKYVVINSGHTFHEKDFKASNSWLFPRLGDIAVLKIDRKANGSFEETILLNEIFNGGWKFEPKK